MRGFGFIGALGFLVLLFIAGAIGFGLGQNAVPAAVPAPGTPVVYYGHGGFGFFGFLLFLFLIFAVIGIFRRAAWGGRGWGHHGYYGKWSDRSMPPMADEMLGRWHREAHGDQPPTTNNQPTSQG
jgi:hypothetical protein